MSDGAKGRRARAKQRGRQAAETRRRAAERNERMTKRCACGHTLGNHYSAAHWPACSECTHLYQVHRGDEMSKRWKIETASDLSQDLYALLDDGWEPFAVASGNVDFFYLRKEIKRLGGGSPVRSEPHPQCTAVDPVHGRCVHNLYHGRPHQAKNCNYFTGPLPAGEDEQ